MLNDYPVLDRDFDEVTYRLVPLLRASTTPDDIAAVLASEAADEDLEFSSIATYSLRGNNVWQVRYLLSRLTFYVEEGCRKANESERYLTPPHEWHIEHLWPNVHEKYIADEPNLLEFRTLRNKIGALGLLPSGDNCGLGAPPLVEKIEFYAPQNILVGVLDWKGTEEEKGPRGFGLTGTVGLRVDGAGRCADPGDQARGYTPEEGLLDDDRRGRSALLRRQRR